MGDHRQKEMVVSATLFYKGTRRVRLDRTLVLCEQELSRPFRRDGAPIPPVVGGPVYTQGGWGVAGGFAWCGDCVGTTDVWNGNGPAETKYLQG